ncbi:MAG: DUF2927 domain-containing protein [Pseudomonadota bacterium]
MKALLAILLATGSVAAQEFVAVPGPIDDHDFYRLVACAAEPGGACRKPFLRWDAEARRALGVSLASVSPALAPYKRPLIDAALDAAVAQINDVDAGLHLVRVPHAAAIDIHIVDTPPGGVMSDTGVEALDGAVLPLGRVALLVSEGQIPKGIIAISAFAGHRAIASVLLEEITQALGLMTDIRGPAYKQSIFSEDANDAIRLDGQDAMALRRHYAGDGEGDG